MPDVSVVTPAVVVPADRLTLGANDARGLTPLQARGPVAPYCCMAEE